MNFIANNPARYEKVKSALRDGLPVPAGAKQAVSHRLSQLHQRYMQDFVFIHINKCGGTALERGLGIPLLNHDTARERRDTLGADAWQERFKFTLVRNPYHRYVSKYFYDDHSGRSYDELVRDFPAWLDQMERENRDGTATRHRRPMKWWVSDADGTLMVDRVYKLETLDEALEEISDRLGRKVEMKRVKENPFTYDRNDILGSTELRQRLHALLREDFEAFGYDP